MKTRVEKQEMVGMLQGAVAQIRANHGYLTKLDSAIGDGDHGTTILKVMENVAKSLAESGGLPLKDLLFNAGMAAASTDGGSSAPLIGSFFMGMADPAEGKESLSTADLAAVIVGGIEAVKLDSKARVGDKTMMDALLPVLDVLRGPLPEDVQTLLSSLQRTALSGAEATKNLVAKFGRAKNLGERVIGNPDPGAYSIAFIFKGFAESI
jgi:dihydroxyacetone kinase-like protein